MTMTPQFADDTSLSNLFDIANLFSSLVIGSSFMSVTKGLTRNPEIENTPVCVLPNIWRLGRVRDNKFGMNV